MKQFLLDFIRSSLDLFSYSIFAYLFIAFIGVFAVYLIRYVVWGK